MISFDRFYLFFIKKISFIHLLYFTKKLKFLQNKIIWSICINIYFSIVINKDQKSTKKSNIVKAIMNIGYSFNSIKSFKLEITSTKTCSKGIIAGEILVLNLKLSWLAWAIVHIICTIYGRTNIEAMLGILIAISIFDMKLCFFDVLFVFGIRIDALALEFLLYNFALDKSLWFFEVIHRGNNFWIGRYLGCFNINKFRSSVVLYPRRTILVVGSLIESVFSVSRKCAGFSIIHYCKLLQ